MSLNNLLVTLVRHGESVDNQQVIWAGFRDTPLTNNGVSQARALGQAFANVPLTAIYSSDLKRAAMTADEILKANRSIPPPPLVQSKSLREQDFGQAEGQSYASAEWARASTSQDARTFRFPEGESLQEVNARIAKAVRQFVLPRVEALRKSPSTNLGEGTHICIVAHGIAIAELLRVFMALHDDSESSPWANPSSTYKRIRLDNTGWSRLELAVPIDHENGSAGEGHLDVNENGAVIDNFSDTIRSSSRPIYVRILCQNQTEHLRNAGLQTASTMSVTSASHQLGGGSIEAPISSPKPPSSANASPATASKGLSSSATLASIASNATASTSQSMAPPSSTPASSARTFGATPASVRSFNSYDVKNMTRELEKAGASSFLIGSESAPTGATPSSSNVANGSAVPSDRHGTATPASVNAKLGAIDRSVYTPSPAASTTYSVNSYPMSSASTAAVSVLPASYGIANAPSSSSDVWQAICVRVLPLFNGERLRTSIEELNETVSLHVRKTLERSPARAIESLTLDLISLVSSGTLTLNSKLHGLNDSRHLVRLVEIWTFYLTQVLPYIEGCFVPLQTDATLQSLTSASSLTAKSGVISSLQPIGMNHKRIDVRKILLSGFRDQVVLPIYERLFYLFAHIADLEPALSAAESALNGRDDATKQIYFRLLQMVSVLASIQSEDEAQNAVDGLLRALRMGSKTSSAGRHRSTANGLGVRTGSPTQRSSNRRGWMAQKAKKHGLNPAFEADRFGAPTAGNSSDGLTSRSMGSGLPPLGSFKPDGIGRFGFQVSEDEYLMSLQSPGGSPAISTPGPQDPSSTPQPRDHVWSTLHTLSDDDASSPSATSALTSHQQVVSSASSDFSLTQGPAQHFSLREP